MNLRRAHSRCWALAAAASGWQHSLRPLGRRHTPVQAAFHAEGDLSGAFQLSGVWKLERESDDAVEQVPIQPTNPSWSGDRWSDVVRELARKQRQQELLQLDAAGGWRSPPGSPIELRGKWSMDGNAEVTLARFGRHGNHVTETWTGQYDSSANRVEGVVLEGASEPEYAGRFSLTPAFPSLQPVVKNNILRKNETQWRVADVAGEYTLEFQGDGSISAYDIKLLPNRTWTSVGLSATLAGSWNVFDSDVNLASGIDGTGPRLWLWLRRFGQTSSSGAVRKSTSASGRPGGIVYYSGRLDAARECLASSHEAS
jgi:hypothetical protein